MILRVGAALVAALLLVACGDDPGGRYDAQVDQVRDAVEAGDRDAALASLDQLGTEAFQAHAAGDVTDDELAQLAALLEQARAQVDGELPATTTTDAPTTTAAPTTSPAALADAGDGKDGGKGKKGEPKGRGGDDGGDDD